VHELLNVHLLPENAMLLYSRRIGFRYRFGQSLGQTLEI